MIEKLLPIALERNKENNQITTEVKSTGYPCAFPILKRNHYDIFSNAFFN